MRLRPYLLAAGAFAVGSSTYVISGLLPALAAGLDVSLSAAGQLSTAFALTYALAAPLLATVCGRWERRTLLELVPGGGLLLSLNASAIFVGAGLSGVMGGLVIDTLGVLALPLVSAGLGVLALGLLLTLWRLPAPAEPAWVPSTL